MPTNKTRQSQELGFPKCECELSPGLFEGERIFTTQNPHLQSPPLAKAPDLRSVAFQRLSAHDRSRPLHRHSHHCKPQERGGAVVGSGEAAGDAAEDAAGATTAASLTGSSSMMTSVTTSGGRARERGAGEGGAGEGGEGRGAAAAAAAALVAAALAAMAAC